MWRVCVEGVYVEGVHVEGMCVKEGGCVCVMVQAVTLKHWTGLVWEHSNRASQLALDCRQYIRHLLCFNAQ